MKKSLSSCLIALLLLGTLSGCSSMSKKDKGTLIGAGVGAAAGGAITRSGWGAVAGGVGGAVVGRAIASD